MTTICSLTLTIHFGSRKKVCPTVEALYLGGVCIVISVTILASEFMPARTFLSATEPVE